VRGTVEAREHTRGRNVDHVRDQRIEHGPAFGLVEPRHRLAIGGVGAKSIDRLGRKGDQAARGQRARGARDCARVGRDQIGGRRHGHRAT
jgi:hypothetical protein